MFNLKGPQRQTRGPLVVRGPQFEKRWSKQSMTLSQSTLYKIN